MNLRENLLRMRQQSGMTQEQLADRIGVSRQSVAKWETGKATPDVEKLAKLADVFGCTMDELVKGGPEDAEGAPETEPGPPSDEEADAAQSLVPAEGRPEGEGRRERLEDGRERERPHAGRGVQHARVGQPHSGPT